MLAAVLCSCSTAQGGEPQAGMAQQPAAPSPSRVLPSTAQEPVPSAADPSVPVETAPPSIGAAAPVRLQISSVGLDVEVRELPEERSNPINPPTMMEAYWVPGFGLPGTDASDITVIAAHSWTKGDAAFNPLLNLYRDDPAASYGQDVRLTTANGQIGYVVVDIETYRKETLPQAGFWNVVDGCTLILITCFWDQPLNMVVSARRTDCT